MIFFIIFYFISCELLGLQDEEVTPENPFEIGDIEIVALPPRITQGIHPHRGDHRDDIAGSNGGDTLRSLLSGSKGYRESEDQL